MVAQQTDAAVNDYGNRPKKNSIGSWFSRKFGRRPSEVGSPPNLADESADPSARRPTKPKDTRNQRTKRADGQAVSPIADIVSSQSHPPGQSGNSTLAPQLDGIPAQSSLGAIDLPGTIHDGDPAITSTDTALHHSSAARSTSVQSDGSAQRLSDSEEGSHDREDSIGNRTMDTGKSRASTKQTTLMSLDTREPVVLPTTHIAQVRQNDDSRGTSPRLASARRESLGTSAIQFAPGSTSRYSGGHIGAGQGVDSPSQHITIPSHSRPHPINNPHPAGIPSDNASVLTLASSTAGMSYGGGATSNRSHNQPPSVGGARSFGGSVMGDRRNSSDTYASLKALPPLSRRGSDSSSRTRESVAASATGQNSHQAMFSTGVNTGPGAPSDRFSLHRTPSQRTVATQLSVPLSTSASNAALQAHAKDDSGSQGHVALNSVVEPTKSQNGDITTTEAGDAPPALSVVSS